MEAILDGGEQAIGYSFRLEPYTYFLKCSCLVHLKNYKPSRWSRVLNESSLMVSIHGLLKPWAKDYQLLFAASPIGVNIY